MSFYNKIYKQAKNNPKRIVLPEGEEPRIIEAAAAAVKQSVAKITLLGREQVILKKAQAAKLNINKIAIMDHTLEPDLDDYARLYCQLRKPRNIPFDEARELFLADPLYYGVMMLREKKVDGFVAGAFHTTSDVARAVLRCIDKQEEYSTASGSFLVEINNKNYGKEGLFLFADCAIVPEPSEEQLADIALSSAELWSKVSGYTPRVAMLSFSTKGSSAHPLLEKVRRAADLAKKRNPKLIIDGELQADSAIVPEVAQIKTPQSPLKGRANILIFPNLEAGNIAYKLMQRLANARVTGPILQGVSLPCSDLSRGCGFQEIVDAITVTVVRAQ